MKLIITNIFSWMIKNFDLLSIIIATCLTWISRFDFSKSVNVIVRDQLTPESFFKVDSLVYDYPNGSMSSVLHKFRNHDFVIIYSYSHWDAESVLHRDNIEKVADAVQYKIPIISINCWDNNSDCFDTLKPTRFPQLYAFVYNSYFIEYQRTLDPLEIFHFISSLFYPFKFPKSLIELENLLKSHDQSFIISLNSDSKQFSKRLQIFHKTATIYKGESSQRPDICFIVLSESDPSFSDLRVSFNLTTNEPMLYSPMGVKKKFTGKYRSDEMLEFIKTSSIDIFINKYSPNGIKSLNMQNLLKKGVVIFYIYDELQKYLWSNIESYFYFESLARQVTACSGATNHSNSDFSPFLRQQTVSQYLQHHRNNVTCHAHFTSQIYSNFSLNINSYIAHLDHNRSKHFAEYLQDPFVAHSTELDLNWYCRKYLLTKHYEIDDISQVPDNIKSLFLNEPSDSSSCFGNFNRSVSFATMDGDRFNSFLKKWGIARTKITQPQIVVIDWKNELIHHMKSEISHSSLNRLVYQLTIHNLTSQFPQTEYVFPDYLLHQHFYPIDAVQLEQELSDTESDLVVFYYTPWCSYCSSMMHLLVVLARYFKNYPKLHFTSLDTYNNDLPYKYQSERVPALIMFPRGRKWDSCVFDITEKTVSLSSLIRFVLDNSGDMNLNLNAPSPVVYNNEHNVTCNQLCLDSARQSISLLLKTLKTVFKKLRKRLSHIHAKIQVFCQSEDFHWLMLRANQSRDWFDYFMKQYYIRHQAQQVVDFHTFSRQHLWLQKKIAKLSKLKRGIMRMQDKKISNPSVQSLALDILNLSI